ncbi:hypothetical protein BFJ67_g17961 [Fusarium oxysporum f. sp. cepae]|nr:hypothetical protein BFJ67_g17961 [Fusarium oxysporum f. sp. cepae]
MALLAIVLKIRSTSSAALKSNKSNPWSYLIYLTLFGTGFVV